MVTAIGVAAVPVPENYAVDDIARIIDDESVNSDKHEMEAWKNGQSPLDALIALV